MRVALILLLAVWLAVVSLPAQPLALIGMETGDLNEFDSSTEAIETTTVRTGSYALNHGLGGNSVKALRAVVSSGTLWMRFGFRINDDTFTNAAADFLDIRGGLASIIVSLQLNTSEQVILSVGASSDTSTTALSINTWYLIEVRHLISTGSSDGETELYINGTSEASILNHNNTQTVVDFDFNTSSTGPTNHYYDDVLVTTAGRPNDGFIVALLPNADDSTNDEWEDQAAGATTWDKVDERPFSNTDYAITPTSGAGAQTQEWELTTQTVGSVNGAKLIVNARDTGGGGSTEVEIPTSVLSSTNLTGGVTDIDDDPDSPDGLWMAVTSPTNNKATDVRVDFATPSSGTLDTTANAQNFKAYVRKTSESTNPTARIELWENGSLVRAGGETTVTSTTGQLLPTFTWSVSELATSDGSNVECKVVGTPGGGNPSNRASVGVGAVEWNAAIASTTHKLITNNVDDSSSVLSADLGLTTADAWYEVYPSGTNSPTTQADVDAYRIGGEASASGDPRMRINAAYFMIDYAAGAPPALNGREGSLNFPLIIQ